MSAKPWTEVSALTDYLAGFNLSYLCYLREFNVNFYVSMVICGQKCGWLNLTFKIKRLHTVIIPKGPDSNNLLIFHFYTTNLTSSTLPSHMLGPPSTCPSTHNNLKRLQFKGY